MTERVDARDSLSTVTVNKATWDYLQHLVGEKVFDFPEHQRRAIYVTVGRSNLPDVPRGTFRILTPE